MKFFFVFLILFMTEILLAQPVDFNKAFHQKRIVLVFAKSDLEKELLAQKDIFQKAEAGLNERDVALFYITSQAPNTYYLRNKYNSHRFDFFALLIGKDGKVKETSRKPFLSDDIFSLIDAMPMRKAEVDEKPKN